MTDFTVIIPVRWASTRLPGKALAELAGRPLMQHVYERACRSAAAQVVLAVDDQRLYEAAQGFGAHACMTSPQHPSGTDRVLESARLLQLPEDTLLVNVQGDEALIPPAIIDQVAADLAGHPEAQAATLYAPLTERHEFLDPNVVKITTDDAGYALYFSRAPIPHSRDAAPPAMEARRHIGIYAYRRTLLEDFVRWGAHPLEHTEQLEQLRLLAHGARIHAAPCREPVPAGIDTPEDLEKARRILTAQGGG